MDMNDDELIRHFLKSNKREPEDNGFSQRVMSRLPRRPINMARVTTFERITFIAGIALLLTRIDLVQVFCNVSMHTLQFIAYIKHVDFTINPLYAVIALIALTAWAGNKIKSLI